MRFSRYKRVSTLWAKVGLSASAHVYELILNSFLNPMGLSGLEPPTSRLSGVRSNQLSYKPFFNLAATCSPTPSPVQYHRPLRS